MNIPKRQVEFYPKGADPNGPPSRLYAEGETFDVLGVNVVVSDLFEPNVEPR